MWNSLSQLRDITLQMYTFNNVLSMVYCVYALSFTMYILCNRIIEYGDLVAALSIKFV